MMGPKFAAAFLQAQKKIGRAAKDSQNPHFKSKFASLGAVHDACLAAFHEHGIAVLQPTQLLESGGEVVLKTILLHESGEFIDGTYPLRPQKADPQGFGSALTYARRYCLAAMAGVVQDDDDGEQATRPKQEPQRQPEPRAPSLDKLKEGLSRPMSVAALEKVSVSWGHAWSEWSGLSRLNQDEIELRDEGHRLIKEAIEKAREGVEIP